MEFIRDVGEKGQVVIPSDIRKTLGIGPKSRVIFKVVNNEVKIISQRNTDEFLNDFFSTKNEGRNLKLKDIKEIEEESYDLP